MTKKKAPVGAFMFPVQKNRRCVRHGKPQPKVRCKCGQWWCPACHKRPPTEPCGVCIVIQKSKEQERE